MCQLIRFELEKVWCRRSFLISVCALLILNIFFLWYTNLGGEGKPELSSYKKFQSDIAKMSETEKKEYIEKLKQTIDGVSFVRNILSMQNSEMGAVFAEWDMQEHPGMFEAYYDLYESGEYLHYTNSLELESLLIHEVYAEEDKVAMYGSYLQSVQESRQILDGISIFGGQDKNNFSYRNIQKSAADYADLTTERIRFAPSRAIVSTMESAWTDILLILLQFLFVGGLITEEKQKRIFYITRSTKYGISNSILSKLAALLIHCLFFSALFFVCNYLFFGFSAGWCDVTANLQSLAPYRESNLSISIAGYLFLSVITKGLVLFGAGAVMTAVCILSENMVLPYLTGLGLWSFSWALYQFVPAASQLSIAKYINFFGALKTENLYGAYFNLDIGGYPVSRAVLSWIAIGIVVLSGIVLSYIFFVQGKRLQIRRRTKRIAFRFRPHSCLIRHESYKILITNHALMILLAFCALIGYRELTHTYTPSVQEQYYQDIMLRLEGRQTDEKIALIESESARYQEAFEEIDRIDAAVDSGELDEETGSAMKIKWYGVIAFYPAFQRVERQYQFVSEHGGNYIYDTGYLYLLGIVGDGALNDFLLVTIGVILAFSHVVSMEFSNSMEPEKSMEYQNGVWGILCATVKGRRGIMTRKIVVCILSTILFLTLTFLCRLIRVSEVFPVHGLFFAARSIPFYQDWPSYIPAIGLILLKWMLQIIAGVILTVVTLVFSAWRKNHVQAFFFGLLILCGPVILTILGFHFAQWFSVYPLYSCVLG